MVNNSRKLDAADIEIARFGVGNFALVVDGNRFRLSPSGFAKLCRAGNAFKHEVDPAADSGPPYVVHVRIPYQDVDDDQTTPAYNCPVALADRADVEVMIPALRSELEAMGLAEDDYDWTVAFAPVPEDFFFCKNLEPADFVTALSRFRRAVACKSSHDWDIDDDWWDRFGITEEEFEDRASLEPDRFRLVRPAVEDATDDDA